MTGPANIGMTFRMAEAYAVEKLYFSGIESTLPERAKKISRNTWKVVPAEIVADLSVVIERLKIEGFVIIAIEVTEQATTLNEFNFTPWEKIALVLGSERSGISAAILEKVDAAIQIPLFGQNSSINVVNALATTLYEIVRQKGLKS